MLGCVVVDNILTFRRRGWLTFWKTMREVWEFSWPWIMMLWSRLWHSAVFSVGSDVPEEAAASILGGIEAVCFRKCGCQRRKKSCLPPFVWAPARSKITSWRIDMLNWQIMMSATGSIRVTAHSKGYVSRVNFLPSYLSSKHTCTCPTSAVPKLFRSTAPSVPYTHPQRPPFLF